MNAYKYSIVIPVLNGMETLRLTLPEMLKINRDDVEWVISDNWSDDNLYELVLGLKDPRVKVCRPEKRLPMGDNLEFAYSNATGKWQGHLGDDDFLMPSRFTILDYIIRNNPDVSIIRGEFIRYIWHDHPVRAEANKLKPGKYYSGTCQIADSKAFARKSLNKKQVHGGGAWVVHHDIIDKIRKRAGFFARNQAVEFFGMRAALALSNKVALLDIPIYVMGRHTGSAAEIGLKKGRENQSTQKKWDWAFEHPQPYEFCPFQYKSYTTVSLDSAMRVATIFGNDFGGQIDYWYWYDILYREIKKNIKGKVISEEMLNKYWEVVSTLPAKIRWKLKYEIFVKGIYSSYPVKILLPFRPRKKIRKLLAGSNKSNMESKYGWESMTDARDLFGAYNIVELAMAFENTHKDLFAQYK